ncbi:MAG: DUF2089 domain-containing protein [Candidatus Latescibacteria bacterium]|nr:DUF2089 domain-containing protein [Candidatus Latescibacterota bacterium]
MRKILEACPSCGGALDVTELTCSSCETVIRSRYTPCPFCRLAPESLRFLETFVQCRGNIKEMERALRISYPTVRGRLDAVIRELGYEVEAEPEISEKELTARRREILDQLEQGEITASEATKRLAELKP